MEVDVYHRGDDFVQGYKQEVDDDFGYTYDLIILDVEMPGINGIETAKEIRKVDSNAIIMFITNLAEYAIHGYSVEAIDYVPISRNKKSEFMEAFAKYVGGLND